MSERERVTRPVPERTGPIRSWSTLLGAGPVARGPDQPGATDVVSQAVSLGYRVVEEYLRQGERAARVLGGRTDGVATGSRDVQDLTARMAQYVQDFLGLWIELVELAAAGTTLRRPAPPATNGAAPPPAAPVPTSPSLMRVRLEVASARAVEVTVDLRSEASSAPLVVHDLRAAALDLPRLTGVVLEPGDPPCLRLRVGNDQPAGVYHGVIVELPTSRAVGTVTVRVPS